MARPVTLRRKQAFPALISSGRSRAPMRRSTSHGPRAEATPESDTPAEAASEKKPRLPSRSPPGRSVPPSARSPPEETQWVKVRSTDGDGTHGSRAPLLESCDTIPSCAQAWGQWAPQRARPRRRAPPRHFGGGHAASRGALPALQRRFAQQRQRPHVFRTARKLCSRRACASKISAFAAEAEPAPACSEAEPTPSFPGS